ncbi:hypothetical protein G9F32_03305 [Acinetobacter sp. 194]|uniref:hypothetical protein n=1 Tax=Acinetobacter shaoyimingii TaxID=2715164 RepID=UPI00140E8E67|nr:hypothetical protein [Acinetobacter shaoyimingii]NHB57061.1 hypothetical protein [Acinetobacter shaoyimingii]
MLELKLLRKLKKEPYSEYKPVKGLSKLDIQCMYAIFEQYYLNTSLELFESDLSEKTGVFIVRDPKSDKLVGFSTITERDFIADGKVHHAFFSGDTIIEEAYWGSRALQRAMYRYVILYKLRYPTKPVYWMLISKGFKTYLLLANNYYTYYPHYGNKHQFLQEYVEAYCQQYYAKYYDKESGLLNFGDDYQALRPDVAPITEEMRLQNSKIEFFEKCNPTWVKGTELPCIGEIQWKDLYMYVQRFLSKSVSKGKNRNKPVNVVVTPEIIHEDSKVA